MESNSNMAQVSQSAEKVETTRSTIQSSSQIQQQSQQRQTNAVVNIDGGFYNNACCCDCSLQEGCGWISGIEFTWGIINCIVAAGILATSSNSADNLKSGKSRDVIKDYEWKKFGEDHHVGILAAIALHACEFAVAIILMTGHSRRIRSACFIWIFCIAALSLGEIVTVAFDPFSLTYVLVLIIPFRFYFVFIVWSLASEIVKYPQGPPIRVLPPTVYRESPVVYTNSAPVVYSSPVIVPSYGYGYRPYGYGYPYGYPYGYGYGADAALTGLAIGGALGMAGGGYGYDDYYGGGGYYDDNFF